MDKIVWVLDDERVGNTNQAIALGQIIDHNYILKKIYYNGFKYLPSRFLSKYPIHLSAETMKSLIDKPAPDFIISAGRKTSAIALYLKNKYGNTKLLQIMRPAHSSNEFSAIIVPKHDKYPKGQNVIEIIGSLNNITNKIKDASIELKQNYPGLIDFIGVIIGGNTKKFTMDEHNAHELVQSSNQLSAQHSLPLFISFSRRTPENVKKIIKDTFGNHIIYDPLEGGYNPYLGLIGCSKYIIVTSDSISMISEVAASGKPLYIFSPNNFKSKKHLAFIENLLNAKIARILDPKLNQLENYNYIPLNEIKIIEPLIMKLLF